MQRFKDELYPLAIFAYQESHIDPWIIMTQAAYDSSWGSSEQTKKRNKLFNVGGTEKVYDSWLSSLHDWVSFLKTPRLGIALKYAKEGDTKRYAKEMYRAGCPIDPATFCVVDDTLRKV